MDATLSALSGQELLRRLQSKDFAERLVVSPILEPEEQLKRDNASVDVRLGFEFALITPSLIGAIDELRLTAAQRHLELAKLAQLRRRKLRQDQGVINTFQPHTSIFDKRTEDEESDFSATGA